MEHKKKQKIQIALLCLVGALVIIGVLVYPSIYDHRCKVRCYDELESKMTDDVLSGNIALVKKEKKISDGDGVGYSYGVAFSGVVIRSDGDTYYALTAYHAVEDGSGCEYLVLPYGTPTYAEYRQNAASHVSLEMYYGKFEKATLVFADKAYDLAVISFRSKEPLHAFSISENDPNYRERIAVIGNPDGKWFVRSFGTVTSREYTLFKTNDGLPPVKTFQHNAYESHGSSGSAVLSEGMQIVGINIGGGTDFMGRFKYGVMVPCELVVEFLKKNNFA